MSRIGSAGIEIPTGVEITVNKGNTVQVKGPRGVLTQKMDADITISVDNGIAQLNRPTDQKRHKALHGLYRALVANMVVGVTQGHLRELELIGVGYRVSNTGNLLELSVGYSHPIMFYIPDDLKLDTVMEKGKPPYIKIEGIDKQLVNQIAAKVRGFRKPEPYKGKGILYKGEVLRRKVGKVAG